MKVKIPHLAGWLFSCLLLALAPAVSHADLIGFYSFDSAADPLADESGSGNSLGSVGSDPSRVNEGLEGSAYEFNGSQRLLAPIDLNTDQLPQLTMGAWVKTSSLDAGLRKVLGTDNGGWDRTIGLDNRVEDGFAYSGFHGGGVVTGLSAPDSTDAWTFIAAVYDDDASEMTLYLDLDTSSIDDDLESVTQETSFEFGGAGVGVSVGSVGPANGGEGWVGLIDNVFFFDEVLTEEQVKALRDGGSLAFYQQYPASLPSENLAAYYPFDDGDPTADASGNGRPLTSAGADPAFDAAGGISGGGYTFDGSQRWIIPFNAIPDDAPQITMGAWVKTSSLDPGERKFLGTDNGGWDRTLGLDTRNGDFRYTSFLGNGPLPGTPGPVSTDDWAFVAAAYDHDAATVTVYVDTDASTTNDAIASVMGDTVFGAGADSISLGSVGPGGAGEGWQGAIDNVFVYEGVLSYAQIVVLRDGGADAIAAVDEPNIAGPLASPFGHLGQVGVPVSRSVPIRNTSSTDSLTLSAALSGADAAYFTITGAPNELAPGASGDIMVTFDPGTRKGEFKAVIIASSDDPGDPQKEFDISAIVSRGVSGLIAFYPFDNPSNPGQDASLSGRDLRSVGADPVYGTTDGFEGGGYSFDGNQRLIAPVNINPGVLPEATVGAWVKTSTLDSGLRKIMGSDDGGWDRTIGLDNRNGDFRYSTFVGNGEPLPGGPAPVSTDAWTFVAATYDQEAGAVNLYVDLDAASVGEPLTAVSGSGSFSSGLSVLSLGSVHAFDNAEGWVGGMDNVFVFDRVLNVEELREIRDGAAAALLPPVEVPVDKLIGYYTFDNADDPLEDASGEGADLISVDADPVYTTDGGFSGGGYDFSGTNRFIAPVDIGPEANPEVTIGAWVKTTTLEPSLRKVIGGDNGGWDRTVGLDNRNGPLRYSAFSGAGPITGTPEPVSTEDWTFLAVVYNENTTQMTMYVDLDSSTTNDELVAVGSSTTFNDAPAEISIGTVGPNSGSEGWVGGIDNVFIFAAALTAEEVTAVRDAGTAQPSFGDNPDLFISGFPSLSALARSPSAKQLNIQLRNRGLTEVLTISDITLSGRDAAYFKVDSFPETLDANALANIVFTLDSAGQVGDFIATMTISSNDESQPEIQLNLSAKVLPEVTEDPVLTVVTTTPFGELPNSNVITRDVTVRNDGTALNLDFAGATITGENAANFMIVGSPESIAPGGQGSYSIMFDPDDQGGSFRATLEIVSNDGSDRFTTIPLDAQVAFSNLSQALLGFYTFDDPDDPNADSSGKNNPLEAGVADPFYEEDGGFEGGAYDFTGGNLVAPINLNPTVVPELTMGAWVKTSALEPGLHRVISTDNGGWDRAIGLDSRGDDPYAFSAFHGGGVVSGLPAPEDEEAWSFFAGSFNETEKTLTLFLDLDASSTDDDLESVTFEGTTFGAGFETTSIGSLNPTGTGEGWVGYIDNVFIFAATLSGEQLMSIRNGGSAAILGGGEVPPFAITSVEIIVLEGGGTGVEISWTGGPAGVSSYLVEFSTDLIEWEEVDDGVEANSYVITPEAGVSEIYYRVRVP